MIYGIVSDLHSNFEASKTVFDELERRGVEKIICLGDIVGYAASPNECCDLVRKSASYVVLGNHDAGSVGRTSLKSFGKAAIGICQWTGKILTEENRTWLENLPLIREVNGKLMVHASPGDPSHWEYVLSLKDAITKFKIFSNRICFVGHSHVPCSFVEQDNRYNVIENKKFVLKHEARYIINPGSVGQPRDGDSRASFAIYDSKNKKVEIVRIKYDIKGAQQKIIDAELPDFSASRLELGK